MKRELVKIKPIQCVYALCCPFSGEVKYIGRTSNLYYRYKLHCQKGSSKRVKNILLSNWLSDLADLGIKPRLKVIEQCDNLGTLKCQEHYFIEKHRDTILNIYPISIMKKHWVTAL